MTRTALRLCLVLPTALLFTSPADAEPRKTPKGTILCLPPGGTAPRPCATAVAGSTIRLDTNIDHTDPEIYFVSTQGGDSPVGAPARPVAGRDGSYLVTVPRHLCTKDKMGSYEIQHLMSTYNQAESRSRTIGILTVTC